MNVSLHQRKTFLSNSFSRLYLCRAETKGEGGHAGRPPTYLGKHKRPANLAAEARDVVKSVRSLIEVERMLHILFQCLTITVFTSCI